MSFDSILNTAIPIFVVIFFLFILGRALKKPLGELFEWIKGLFSKKEERNIGVATMQYE